MRSVDKFGDFGFELGGVDKLGGGVLRLQVAVEGRGDVTVDLGGGIGFNLIRMVELGEGGMG